MDQQLSIKKFFNYCFNSARLKATHKENENAEGGILKNDSNPESKTKMQKNSRFHRLITKSDTALNHKKKRNHFNFSSKDFEETGVKAPFSTNPTEKKCYLSCLKKNSSGDEAMKQPPSFVAKQDLDVSTQKGLKEENYVVPRIRTSQTLKTEPPTPVIELMSRDGTLKLYSATTLTPLSSCGIQDEERIQTHLSLSCFRPEDCISRHSSEGPDDVFEPNDETSLTNDFKNLGIGHSEKVPEKCDSRVQRSIKSHSTSNKESGYLVNELVPTDDSLSFPNMEKENKLCSSNKSKTKIRDTSNYCPCLETENAISCIYDVERVSKHPRSPTYQKQEYKEPSDRSRSSVTSYISCEIPPVKKWILQLYFSSLIAADENLYRESIRLNNTYAQDNKSEVSSQTFLYAQRNDSRSFNQKTLEGRQSLDSIARAICTDANSNNVSYNCRSHNSPENRKNCLANKYENKYTERHTLEMEWDSFKTFKLEQPRKHQDQYYAEKEKELSQTKGKIAPVKCKSRKKRISQDKHKNSKAAFFSQATTYTHYPFIDGPLPKDFGKVIPTGNEELN